MYSSYQDSGKSSPTVVFTGMMGVIEHEKSVEKRSSVRGTGDLKAGGDLGLEKGAGIVTTVRMEHSYF